MGFISRITGKKHKYMCSRHTKRKSCGKKWGPKVKVKKADGHNQHVPKQCPECERKQERELERCKYAYKCPECGKGHGQKYRKKKYADTSWKRCSKHKKGSSDKSFGGFSPF